MCMRQGLMVFATDLSAIKMFLKIKVIPSPKLQRVYCMLHDERRTFEMASQRIELF